MRYNAFISYRHLPKDKFVAENLHKSLETFKLPKSLYDKCERHGIERVFRDRDELPLSSNLSDPIDEALRESECLIVICTPQLKESRWCIREIETFKQLHGREKIFAVLAEGEPIDSFPEELLYVDYEEKDENGNTVVKRKAIEPLAADVRGKNNREIKKKIKEETVRLVAPMFGLNYDDLKQRHREREIKRKIRNISIVAAFFLVLGIVSTTMAVKIYNQNVEIKKNYAMSLCAESRTLFAEGNLYKARDKAAMAVNYSLTDETKNTFDYVYELNTAYGAHVLADTYKMEDGVNGIFVSPDGKLLAAIDGLNEVSITLTSCGDRVELKKDAVASAVGYAGFISNDKFAYNTGEGLCVYDFAEKEDLMITSGYSKIFVSDDNKYLGVVTLDEVLIFDTASMKQLAKCPLEVSSDCAADFSEDGKVFSVAMVGADATNGYVTLIDTSSGKTISHNPFNGGTPISISCTDKVYALSLCDAMTNKATTSNTVLMYDVNGELKWISDAEAELFVYVDICDKDSKVFACQSNRATLMDLRTGEEVGVQPVSGAVYLCKKISAGKYALTLLDSNVVEYDADSKSTRILVNYDVMPTLRCGHADVWGKELFIHFAGMDYISVYRIPEGEEPVEVSSDAASFSENRPEGVVYFQENLTNIYLYDERMIVPESESSSITIHSADCKYLICYGDGKSVRIYENGSNDPLYTLPINTGTINYMMFSEDGGWFAVNYQNGSLELYDALTGEAVTTLEKDYPYVFDVINVPDKDAIIIDAAYETKILDGNFNEKTTYQKTGEMMCVGYDMTKEELLIQSGNSINAVPLE